tara:strand:- start:159 stop:1715 length:1557 start_codon:yes stop_codon:yes gene_type:complete
MAHIPIWPGSSSFATGITAYGFYDNDNDFQVDAPLVATWVTKRLGYPLVDIELQDCNLYTAFEEAVTEYGHQVYTFQIINNLFRIKGNSTGSSLNQIYLDDYYGSDASAGQINQGGSGTSYNLTDKKLYTASLDVRAGQQKYNLLSQRPELASATVEFTGAPAASESIIFQGTNQSVEEYIAHVSTSGYFVSSSLNQFAIGGTPTETAANLASVIENETSNFTVASSSAVVTITQRTEGKDGNTAIDNMLSNTTTTDFIGGDSGLTFEFSGSAIQAGDKAIKIKKIYHYAPSAINRYFDPYAGTGTGIQSLMQAFGFGNYSPGVNFMLMPIYFDALKLQAIEFNDQIRKSAYHFELNAGRFLKLFPIPQKNYKLWFEYTLADSSISPAEEEDASGNLVSKPKHLVTDISNAPYERPIYEFINEPGRQWIRKYTLALAKEMLGSVRGKYATLPIPGSETTLDYTRLLAEAQAEKEALITQLREDLEATTTLKQSERRTAESEQTQMGYSLDNPYQIYIH